MLTRKQKQELIDGLSKKIKESRSIVFADYKGLNVGDLKELRKKLKTSGVELKVAKKTLIDLAFKKAAVDNVSSKKMDGQVALALSFEDEIAGAKILREFSRKHENLKILAAWLEGNFLGQAEAMALAQTPSKEQSRAQLVNVLASPISGFLSVLQGNLRSLTYVLSQIKK